MRINWDQDGQRLYECGVRKGVIYPKTGLNGAYATGVAWNGLRSVTESPEGGESNKKYANDTEYLNIRSKEKFKGSIGAYTCPKEFYPCDGIIEVAKGVYATSQNRKPFGLCYRTAIGSDTDGDAAGYKIHIVYNASVSPTERNHESEGEDIEPDELSWEFETLPVDVAGADPTAHIIIDSRDTTELALKQLENAFYGCGDEEFSATKTYALGDTVVHGSGENEKTYECKVAIETPGEWDETDWNEVSNPEAHILTPAEIKTIAGTVTTV